MEQQDRLQRRIQVLQQHLGPADAPVDVAGPAPLPTAAESNVAGIESRAEPGARRRAVIIAGARTPFVKSFGELMQVDTIGLGVAAVSGLLQKTKLDPTQINEVIWGAVVLPNGTPNVAREIVLDLNLPRNIPGVTVSRACLSGLQVRLHP